MTEDLADRFGGVDGFLGFEGFEGFHAGTGFGDPVLGKVAGLNVLDRLVHCAAGFRSDDGGADLEAAPFGGVADGLAHLGEATVVDEVSDEFGFVDALEVGGFGAVSGGDEGFIAGFEEFGDASAEDGLFAEEIAVGFFAEGGFHDEGAEGPEAVGVGEDAVPGVSGGVLVDGDNGGEAASGEVFTAEFDPGTFGADKADVDVCGEVNEVVDDVEAVGEEEALSGSEGWEDLGPEVGDDFVRKGDHEGGGGLGGFGDGEGVEAFGLGFGEGMAFGTGADDDLVARIAEVEGVGVALVSITDDGNGFGLEDLGVEVGLVEESGHGERIAQKKI